MAFNVLSTDTSNSPKQVIYDNRLTPVSILTKTRTTSALPEQCPKKMPEVFYPKSFYGHLYTFEDNLVAILLAGIPSPCIDNDCPLGHSQPGTEIERCFRAANSNIRRRVLTFTLHVGQRKQIRRYV